MPFSCHYASYYAIKKKLSGITEVIINEGCEEIGEGAFNSCSFLSVVTLPQSLESIGDFAFYGCI